MLLFLLLSVAGQPYLFRLGAFLLGFMSGYLLPAMWLGGKIRRRQNEIIKALPDALDLLTICVEAGLGFDLAMGKVAENGTTISAKPFPAFTGNALGKARVRRCEIWNARSGCRT